MARRLGSPWGGWARGGVALLLAACGPGTGTTPAASGGPAMEPSTSSDPPPASDARPLVVPPLQPCETTASIPDRIRIVGWNIASGRVSSLGDVTTELRALSPDIVVVQEVDRFVRRTAEVDQPRQLAETLGYAYAFAAAIEYDGGDFGLLVLSRLPFSKVERISLDSRGASEDRIALDVTVCAGSLPLRVVDVHADFIEEVNVRNLTEIAAWVEAPAADPVVIAGDFNASPDTAGVRALGEAGWIDLFSTWDPGPTHDGRRLDYVFTDPGLAAKVDTAQRVQSSASDHTPLLVDLRLR